jgi:hypothetical protein
MFALRANSDRMRVYASGRLLGIVDGSGWQLKRPSQEAAATLSVSLLCVVAHESCRVYCVQITNRTVLALRRRSTLAGACSVRRRSNHTALFAAAAARWRGMAMPLLPCIWQLCDACDQEHDRSPLTGQRSRSGER